MYSVKKREEVYFLVADTLIFAISLALAVYLYWENTYQTIGLALLGGLPILWFFIVYWQKLYITDLYQGYSVRLLNFLKSCSILVVMLGVLYVIFTFPLNLRNAILAFAIGFPIAGAITNCIIISIINRLGTSEKTTLLVAMDGPGLRLDTAYYHNPAFTYRETSPTSSLVNEPCEEYYGKNLVDVDYMKDYLNTHHVDEILLSLPVKKTKKIKKLLEIADYHGTRVKIAPDYHCLVDLPYMTVLKPLPMNARPLPLDNWKRSFSKELFDWAFSGMMLILLAPVFLVIAVLIKLDSPRPVFYCPMRIGKGGKPFKLYKFSTMKESDPVNGGTRSTEKDDPRITKLGRILRKYSIDELPQFLNVFLGNMSVVGPRPHRSYLSEQFQRTQGNYMIRHYYKPGITGWAQVNGWRGPTTTDEQKYQRTVHDLWYLENWSFKLDLKIIYMTVFGSKVHKSAF